MKKRIVSVSLIITLGLSLIGAGRSELTQTEIATQTEAKMNVEIDTNKNIIKGDNSIVFENRTKTDLDEIYIRYLPPSILKDIGEGGSAELIQVKQNTKALDIIKHKDNSVYSVKLNESLKPGGKVTLDTKFISSIPNEKERFGYQNGKKIKKEKIYQLSFFYPTASVLKNGKWNTNPYFSYGETGANTISNYEVKLSVPKTYQVAASGDKVKSTTNKDKKVYLLKGDNLRDFAMVASNFIKKSQVNANGVKVNVWHQNDKKGNIFNKIAKKTATIAIKGFTNEIGKYPYGELDIVQTFGGDMEYSGLVMIDGSSSIKNRQDYERVIETTTSHEIGHQWFYSTVGNDQYDEAWLDEGITTYCESVIYRETKYPKANILKEYGDLSKPEKINKRVDEFNNNLDYANTVYSIGNEFLIALRRTMGDEKFSNALKEYYRTYYLKEATTEDFASIIKKHDKTKKIEYIVRKYTA
ncbi:MAG: M1 family metallopeptidase [Anaerovoracaceae bacterium]